MLSFEVRRKVNGGLSKILQLLKTKDNNKEPKLVFQGPTRQSNSDFFEVAAITKVR